QGPGCPGYRQRQSRSDNDLTRTAARRIKVAKETVLVPDIGGSDAAEVVEVLVAPGDTVEVDQGLIVLESDKASMEIPATMAGIVTEVLAKEGDELGEGAPVAVIESDGAGAEPAADSADSADNAESTAPAVADAPAGQPAAAEPASAPAQEPAAVSGEPQVVSVNVPDIGTDDEVDLVEVSVAVGDTLDEGDTIVVLESDKASMEVPSPAAGEVVAVHVSEGQAVKEGALLIDLRSTAGGSAAPETSAPAAPEAKATAPATQAAAPAAEPKAQAVASSAPVPAPSGEVYAGPAVRKLAREFGISLDLVAGTGPRGRILKGDLHAFSKKALAKPAATGGGVLPEVPEVDFSAFGPVDVVDRTKIDKVTAANMQRSWLNVPHVTQFDDADITDMETFRKGLKAEAEKRGTKLTPMPFLIKACAVALKRHEKINSSLSDGGETLTYKRYVHIGMAVDTPAGLVVPVIRDVDKKSLWDISAEVMDLAAKARDRKLKPTDMQGAGFTISSLGAIGGRGFTPVVNTPEVAILGVGRASIQPAWDGSQFQPRQMLPLGLSYDHRVVNGGDAGRFMTELVELLGDIRKQLL
ncbi:MAG: dihydrolipoyllysine-residue acetyltransferase, partial [Verrucomicrobiota bacterium]